MAKLGEYDVPDELYYHKEHMWVRVEGDEAVVGLNDFSQKLAGEISYMEMPEEGDEVKQDEAVGSYETGKWLGKLYAPISGEITAMNEEAEDEPTLVNKDPYGKGWLFKIKMSDSSQVKSLMQGEDALKWLREEIGKHPKKGS